MTPNDPHEHPSETAAETAQDHSHITPQQQPDLPALPPPLPPATPGGPSGDPPGSPPLVSDHACRRGDEPLPARLGRTRAVRIVRQLAPKDRVAACGRMLGRRTGVAGGAPLPTGVEWHQSEAGTVRAAGLAWCGDAWGCADCWTPAAMHYAAVVTEVLAGWQPAGRSAVMFTLTVPHRRGDPLGALWDALGDGWRWLTKHNDWRLFRARWDIAEWCATTEPQWSDETGHHPHDHGLLLLNRAQLTEVELDRMVAQLTGLWAMALRAAGWDRKLNLHHGVSVVPVDDVGDVGPYLFKHAGLELAAPAGTKVGRASTSIPLRDVPVWLADTVGRADFFAVAKRDATVAGRARAWMEYRTAASGRRAFRHSRGFYSLSGAKPMGVGAIRRNTVKLRIDDRRRVDAALDAAGWPKPAADDDEPSPSDGQRPPVLAMSGEAFGEVQGALESPARQSGLAVLEVLQANRDGLAAHAVVSLLIERHGPERTAWALVAVMARPPGVWKDTAGTVILSYHPEREWLSLPVLE